LHSSVMLPLQICATTSKTNWSSSKYHIIQCLRRRKTKRVNQKS